ncbi:glutamate-rich protein 5 [Myiozetetes cayanensis]|uniref:glutamate-rich protein 5 n=1 Tax=Myiozetetes cayanensis TaxID=478635 RepID=UPI00215FD9E7|nr:glutamate-rich protein 5 [Myiozetetes cayanensis]
MILDVEEKTDSVSKREEPEGTEPEPAGAEESSELPSVWREESNGPSPAAPEDVGAPSPGPAEDSGLVEGSDSSVVEAIDKVHITEEDHLIEGETGEQVETELLSETVSGGPETKEETGEAVDSAAATDMAGSCFLHFNMRASKILWFTLRDIFGSNQLEVMVFTWIVFIQYMNLTRDTLSSSGENARL